MSITLQLSIHTSVFIKIGPVPTCGAVLKVHFDQMFVTASRKDDILKPQQKIARKPFLFSSAVHVDMVDRKNNCDETRMRFQIFHGV